jgi:hypothetical protein
MVRFSDCIVQCFFFGRDAHEFPRHIPCAAAGPLRLTATYSITSSLPLVFVEISSRGRPTPVSAIKRAIVGLSFSGSSVQNGFGNAHSSPSSAHFCSLCFLTPVGNSCQSSMGAMSAFIPAFFRCSGSSKIKSLCSPDAKHKSASGSFLGINSRRLSRNAGRSAGSAAESPRERCERSCRRSTCKIRSRAHTICSS